MVLLMAYWLTQSSLLTAPGAPRIKPGSALYKANILRTVLLLQPLKLSLCSYNIKAGQIKSFFTPLQIYDGHVTQAQPI